MQTSTTYLTPVQTRQRITAEQRYFLYVGAHVVLAIAMRQSSQVATVHAVLVLLWGLRLVLGRVVNPAHVTMYLFYVVGAEVMWRVNGASVFWEAGKYSILVVSLLAAFRSQHRMTIPIAPVAYILLLLPSLSYYWGREWSTIRDVLSFNFSGPAAIVAVCIFFSNITLERDVWRRCFLVILGPIFGLAAAVNYILLTTPNINFGDTSNLTTGMGGPNQVSNILGAGVVVCWFLIMDTKTTRRYQVLLTGASAYMFGQALLTFSRGGIWSTVIVLSVTLIAFLLFHPTSRSKVRLQLSLLGLAAAIIVFLPQVDQITGGAATQRAVSSRDSRRLELIGTEFRIWQQSPIIGVGPGQARYYGLDANAHVEFTRVLAEHGLVGVAGMFILLGAAALRILKLSDKTVSVWILGMMLWAMIYMLQAAMRTAAPALFIGIAWVSMLPGHRRAETE